MNISEAQSSETVTEPMGNLSPAERRRMAEIGPIWGSNIARHRDIVLEIYTPRLARAPKAGVKVARNFAYGAHPRQVLDVFQPEGASGAPVLVFVHGGAFVRGDKTVNGEVYDNVLYYFARHGVLGVNIEYRLAPEAAFPCGAEDVHGALQWVKQNAARFGGDPLRIFPFGHSAGGAHVATWAFDPNVAAKPGPEVKGIVIASGRVRADALPDNPNANAVRAYFGDDPSRYEERSPVIYANRCALPVFIAIAEFDNPYLDVYCAELFHRLSVARKRSPPFVRMSRHNHISIMAHFNTEEDILGRQILDFIASAP